MEAAIFGKPASEWATRTFFPVCPPLAPIELGDQREPTIRRGVQLTGQFRDLRFEFIERKRGFESRCTAVHASLLILDLYPVVYENQTLKSPRKCAFFSYFLDSC